MAFVIVGVTLAATVSTFEIGLAGVDRAENRALALMLAESKLAEVGVVEPLAEGRREGEFAGGYRWRTVITRMTEAAEAASSAIVAYRVDVEVAAAGRVLVDLHTVRLGVDGAADP